MLYCIVLLLLFLHVSSHVLIVYAYASLENNPQSTVIPVKECEKDLYNHIAFFSSLGSRFTGYPGSYAAADYIARKFQEFGLNVTFHKYKVLVPLEKKAIIEVLSGPYAGHVINGCALYPNLIQTCSTPPEGFSGRLIFTEGGLAELEGKNLTGSIVVLGFNSGQDWIRLSELGARAVIFFEPSFTDRMESMSKFLQTPLHFPRIYISSKDAIFLKRALEDNPNIEVRVIMRISYEWVEAVNVIGMINGIAPSDVIMVSAHYDSWSVVPSKSPAADEATSVASLIELARYFSQGPVPLRSLWFVAYSGHWQGLAGAREFVNDFLFSKAVQEGNLRIWMNINLDFSTGSNKISVVYTSHFYKLNVPVLWETWMTSRLQNYIRDLEAETGTLFSRLIDININPYGWWGRIPSPYITDSDPIAITGSMAISLVTSEDMRILWGTPINDINRVNLHNALTQLTVAQYFISRFANEPNWDIGWEAVAPRRFVVGGTIIGGTLRSSGSGFATLGGNVVEYNVSRGWFDPVPYALITVQSSISNYPFSTIIVKSDKEGAFSIHGLIPFFITSPPTWYTIQAWVLDENDNIIYAPNLGLYGRDINTPVSISGASINKTIAVFRCKSVVLYYPYDPHTLMKPSVPDGRSSLETFYSVPVNILPYDFSTGAECLWYGRYFKPYEPVAMLFVHPEDRFIVKINYNVPISASVFLTNSSSKWPEGYGYIFHNKAVIQISVPSQAAVDMYRVTKSRYEATCGLLLRNPSVEKYLKMANEHLDRMLKYKASNMHSRAYEEGLVSWTLSIMSYNLFMRLVYESSLTISAVVAIIIPAALFLERLLTSTRGYKRFISLLITMIFMFLIFILQFPGFKILEIRGNPLILIMAIPLAYLLIFSFTLLIDISSATIKRRREEKLGVHEIKRRELSFLIANLSLPIGHIKKRRLRTALILIAIIINTIAMTSFASISPVMLARIIPLNASNMPSYEGYLLKRYSTTAFQIIDEPLIYYLNGVFENGSVICPRVWVYPQTTLPTGDLISNIYSSYGSYRVEALIGLSAYEANTLFRANLYGVNFVDQDTFVCLIPRSLSEALNVTVFDTILWNGVPFIVKGVFDEKAITKEVDLDGYSMAPFDPLTIPAISHLSAQEGAVPTPISFHAVIVIPYRTALKLGGNLVSVAVRSSSMANISTVVDILSLLNMFIFVGKDQFCYSLSRTVIYELLGLEPILVLSVIASLNILVMMLGAVNERKREIMIHSALGLDPRSSSLLFLLETLALSVIGISLGYLIGINLNYILIAHNLLPTNFAFNYSSTAILIIVVILLFFCLSSTAYPAYIAAKLITPSYERKWRIKSKPKGNEWEIPLPFVVPKHEVVGLLKFLTEYYSSIGEESIRRFKFRNEIKMDLRSEEPSISSIVALAPYDANITQLFTLKAIPTKGDQYTFSIILKQLTGIELKAAWVSSNYNFIDSIRKQFLIWRSFSDSEKRRYIDGN